ncbi:MAG: type II secretion system ATPase GspE [Deltaproteobacteria bacterium]|nr:type II secretion system ATPase GspE [Deltaproteobacteria bacterium]
MSAATDDGNLELGSVLLRTTRLTPEQLDEARHTQETTGRRLIDVLVDEGHVDETEAARALGEQLGLPVRELIRPTDVDEDLLSKVPIAFARLHHLLPLHRDETTVSVAVSDPFDTTALDDLRLLFDGAEINTELASRRVIVSAINDVYDLDAMAHEISHQPQDLLDASNDAPIIRLVNSLLQSAVKERASDIHLEPFEEEIRVRFRIDDVLYEPIPPLPRSLQGSIASRIKIMGGLNIAEKRLPQDGRIRLKIAGKDYDVRLSTVPVAHGERLVMRLLPRSTELLNLTHLGFNKQQLEVWSKLISRPNGIVLVTGPTGSGKTTTLYGALAQINGTDKNILTIEDPVEIQLRGVGQVEVNPKIGLTFAAGLRSFLRQDPNVILVGEIRDLETAEIAIQASLTGHLVFSTLHTNDASSALTRLVDMGVEPFLVGSSLVAVLAQRLVRVLCTDCREAYDPTDEEFRELGIRRPAQAVTTFRAGSCGRCSQTGYRGRVGIFEMLLIDDEIRALVTQNTDAKSIKRKAMALGMHTLRIDGARKVLAGVTSVAEILRATEDEGVVAEI